MRNFDVGSTQAHQDLGKALYKVVSSTYPDLVMIPYTVGMFRDFNTADRIIHSGIAGVPDWIIFGNGFYVFFDVKTGKATFSKEQRAFALRIKELNIGTDYVYKIKSVDQGLNILKNIVGFHAKK